MFDLVDNLVSGVIGILTIARTRRAALENTLCGLKFIRRIVSDVLYVRSFAAGQP